MKSCSEERHKFFVLAEFALTLTTTKLLSTLVIYLFLHSPKLVKSVRLVWVTNPPPDDLSRRHIKLDYHLEKCDLRCSVVKGAVNSQRIFTDIQLCSYVYIPLQNFSENMNDNRNYTDDPDQKFIYPSF